MAVSKASGTQRWFPELRLLVEADRSRFARRYHLITGVLLFLLCRLVNPFIGDSIVDSVAKVDTLISIEETGRQPCARERVDD